MISISLLSPLLYDNFDMYKRTIPKNGFKNVHSLDYVAQTIQVDGLTIMVLSLIYTNDI